MNNASNVLGTCLIRYADILLMKAEALIWKNGEGDSEAKSLLNQIRKRAGLPENSQATKVQLKNERRCELAFEFQPSRHLDLVRWHDAQEAYAKPLHGVKTTTNPDGSFNVQEVEIWPARTFNPNVNHVFCGCHSLRPYRRTAGTGGSIDCILERYQGACSSGR